jgi:hypothetical protein
MWHDGVPSDLNKPSYLRIDKAYEVAIKLLKPFLHLESTVKMRLKMDSFKELIEFLADRKPELITAPRAHPNSESGVSKRRVGSQNDTYSN